VLAAAAWRCWLASSIVAWVVGWKLVLRCVRANQGVSQGVISSAIAVTRPSRPEACHPVAPQPTATQPACRCRCRGPSSCRGCQQPAAPRAWPRCGPSAQGWGRQWQGSPACGAHYLGQRGERARPAQLRTHPLGSCRNADKDAGAPLHRPRASPWSRAPSWSRPSQSADPP